MGRDRLCARAHDDGRRKAFYFKIFFRPLLALVQTLVFCARGAFDYRTSCTRRNVARLQLHTGGVHVEIQAHGRPERQARDDPKSPQTRLAQRRRATLCYVVLVEDFAVDTS